MRVRDSGCLPRKRAGQRRRTLLQKDCPTVTAGAPKGNDNAAKKRDNKPSPRRQDTLHPALDRGEFQSVKAPAREGGIVAKKLAKFEQIVKWLPSLTDDERHQNSSLQEGSRPLSYACFSAPPE